MSSDNSNKIVQFPKAEIAPEEQAVKVPKAEVPSEEQEQARRLKAGVERLAQLTGQWLFWLEGDAEKLGVSPATLKAMVEETIKANAKKAHEDRIDDRRRERRDEKKEERERQEQVQAAKAAERARKEAERIEREQEEQRKKRETVFAEIANLPRMTHVARLNEAAVRLGEDPETLIEEFELFFAARSLPAALVPWPDPVSTAELLAGIEAKFRRYVVASDAIATAVALYVPFTYVVEIARYAPKLLFYFQDPNAGKSTALQVIYWMVLRPYLAVDATGAAIYRIIDQLRPITPLIDEADTLFARNTMLARIMNTSWDNSGAKIPRAGPGKTIIEYDVYGTQVIGMCGLNMPATTLSRCLLCQIWPKLPSEVVDNWEKQDDEEFVTLRRKALRWSVDNAVTLQAARPEGQGFNNRVRDNWRVLWAIGDLGGPEWAKRARAAAVELEAERDEPSEGIRLLAAIRDVFGTRKAMTSADLCAALAADPGGEWANYRGRGPIGQIQLAVSLKGYRIKTEKVMSPAGVRLNGYFRAQFNNAFARLLP